MKSSPPSLRIRAFLVVVLVALGAALTTGIALARSDSNKVTSPTAGVVIIETSLGFQQANAAGTGMVLTRNGEVLTNNHVIRGATTIHVRVPQTGRTYNATVAGYSITGDTALLKLQNASGLTTVSLGQSAKVKVGQLVRAVGNANGAGRLALVRGKVVALNRSITVSDESGSARLTSLVQTTAPLEPGDSGGPLLDSSNHVIGMDTAANASRGPFATSATASFAIPIARAMTIVKQIEAGKSSATVHVGGTAFLGVSLQQQGGSLVVVEVVSGSPAEQAGLAQGDEIVAVDGTSMSSMNQLVTILQRKSPGDRIALTWFDTFGQQQTQTATLVAGPPQ